MAALSRDAVAEELGGGNIVYQRLCMTLLGMALLALAGAAQAQCENLRVVVRNSVYAIHGLDAFCSEFNKMKADLADMRSALSLAARNNRLLSARLADAQARLEADPLIGPKPAEGASQAASANRKSSQ